MHSWAHIGPPGRVVARPREWAAAEAAPQLRPQVTLSSKRVVRFGSGWSENSCQQSPCALTFDTAIPPGSVLLGAPLPE